MKVVISSVTKQHAYPIALAAYESGLLKQFVTSIYYEPNSLRYRLLDRIVKTMPQNGDRARLKARRQEGLPTTHVVSIAWPEVIEQVWKRSRMLSKVINPDSVTYLKNELFDFLVAQLYLPPCDLFHGFEQCALFSLRRAKQRGAITLLDEPVIHRALWDRLESQERQKLGLPSPKRPLWYHKHIERKYKELELADYLFVGLDFVKRSFVEKGFPADRIFLIPYGADISAASRSIERPRRRTFNILFVGQISWYKGLHYFLEAYDKLKLQDVSLTIVGMVHSEWMAYFQERFRRVRNPLVYLGTVPHSEMPKYYADADVFVFPSLGGGIGLAVYEAMAAGLPIITADGDVVIRDGVDGLVVPPEDTDGWVKALTRLKEHEELRIQLGANAAQRVREFGWGAYRAGVVQAYQEIGRREGILKASRSSAADQVGCK